MESEVIEIRFADKIIGSYLFQALRKTSQGIAAIYPDYDKPINANIAADMREALGFPNTFQYK